MKLIIKLAPFESLGLDKEILSIEPRENYDILREYGYQMTMSQS